LQCPQEVFSQLLHEKANDEAFEAIASTVDWGKVRWELTEISGVALRHMHVDRMFRLALDEARDHAVCYGIVDEREEVEAHWRDSKSWTVPPVAVSGELLAHEARFEFELLVGFTRLGNLLGMLDRQEIAEFKTHLVWIGRMP
jgi:nitrogen fixation protein FixH